MFIKGSGGLASKYHKLLLNIYMTMYKMGQLMECNSTFFF